MNSEATASTDVAPPAGESDARPASEPAPPAVAEPHHDRWAPRASAALARLGRGQIFALAMTLIGGLYIVRLGSYGLFDCWETYYNEVDREMVAGNDYLSPRWHNGTGPEGNAETNFWSKPVLTFWLGAAMMRLTGVKHWTTPGVTALSHGTEWALRMPSALLGLFAIFMIMLAVGRIFGTRAGVLSGAVLALMPQWEFLSHQAITDMPYVGPMTAALCFVMLAWFGDEVPLRRRLVRDKPTARLKWLRQVHMVAEPLPWVVIGVAALLFLAQVVAMFPPLLHTPLPIGRLPTAGTLVLLPYSLLMGAYVVLAATRTRTRNEVYLQAAYILVAAAFLAKGILGIGLPGIVLVLYFIVGRDLKVLRRLELVAGLPLVIALAFPWVHAMLVAHGRAWWNELFVENQFRRAGKGEQSQAVGTCEYYLRELGYGMFPLGALVPAALAQRFGRAELAGDSNPDRGRRFVMVWFIVQLAFWALVITKYHHYILPALPPAAILIGLFLDDLLGDRVSHAGLVLALSAALVVVVGLDLAHEPEQWVWLFTYLYTPPWDQGVPRDWIHLAFLRHLFHKLPANVAVSVLGFSTAVFAALFAALGVRRLRKPVGVALAACLLAFAIYTLDGYLVRAAQNWTQKDTIAYYYAHRASADEPIVAWQLNWRGETFYTDAEVVVSMSSDNTALLKYLNEQVGKHVWFVTEANRLEAIRSMLPTPRGKQTLRLEYDKNVHFMLASATL